MEVKGIQGTRLAFNLTPKELWRATIDDSWVLVAVLSVLSPTSFSPVLLDRKEVVEAPMVATGYRVGVES